MLNNWIKNSLQKGLPSRCLLCDAPGFGDRDICRDCFLDLPKCRDRCSVCALPLSIAPLSVTPESPTCGQCLKHQPYFDHSFALFDYQHPMDYLIQRFKYHQGLSFGRLLGRLMHDGVLAHDFAVPQPQLLIPVPLHKKRLRQRGFNQALELAKPVAKALQVPLDFMSCTRIRDTGNQSSMSANKRKTNIKHAFNVVDELSAEHVAIVDDVMTTGNTANELARVLKVAGISTVSIWVLARAHA